MHRKLIVLLAAPAILGAQQTTATASDTTFRPISLADALRLANDNNVTNIISDNAIRTANNGLRSARAQWYPNLQATAGQSIQQGDRLGPSNSLIPISSKWAYSTNLSSSMTV